MQVLGAAISRVLPKWLFLLLFLLLVGTVSCERDNTTATYRTANTTIQDPHKSSSEPTWVVNPVDPGEHLPPEGRSLFDFLVTEQVQGEPRFRVPFPFAELLQHIKRKSASEEEGTSWKGVLVPFNRSLQRHAPKPDYLAFPRAVVSVDTEPTLQKGAAGLLLQDRLFLAYQEKSNILEVISYNETAGRFEFQIVTNYGPGLTPKVQYANRTLCITCHQNHSSIFSKPLWKETNSNPEIALLLDKHGQKLYGIPVHQSVDVSQAIDDSTSRASALSVSQFLWQEGCEKKASFKDSVRCRGDLLQLLLQFRLNGRRQIHAQPQINGKSILTTLLEGWNWKWPQGLLVPNSDIPNRDPFDFFHVEMGHRSALFQQVSFKGSGDKPKIRSIFEPSLPREPLVIKLAPNEEKTRRRILNSFSQFLAKVDIKRLDRYLVERWPQVHRSLFYSQGSCEGTVRGPAGNIDRIMIQCPPTDPLPDDTTPGFSMEGVLYIKNGHLTKGIIEHLRLSDGQIIHGLEIIPSNLTISNHVIQARFGLIQPYTALHGRQANGMAIKEITLELTYTEGKRRGLNRTTLLNGRGSITVVDDFSTIQQAVKTLVEETIAGDSDALAYKPFRRPVVMKALFHHLKMPPLTWCCVDDLVTPPAASTAHDHNLDSSKSERGQSLAPGLKLLQKYCADCHHEEEPFPPNFLHGSIQKVQTHVRTCASRIFARLQMWDLDPEERNEAPMPPMMALSRNHLSPNTWRDHSDFSDLQAYVTKILQTEMKRAPDLGELLATGYDNLPECMRPTVRTINTQRKSVES